MIDVENARAKLNDYASDHVVPARAQFSDMLTEIELGQQARRALAQLKAAVSVAAIAANSAASLA